jgi:restriction system protein
MTRITGDMFRDCKALLNITIPDSVTIIEDDAFLGCESLTSISIPNGVKSIGDNVFNDCKNLTSVIIGNGVTSIGDRAFYDCEKLTSIVIPNSVTSIGEYAFLGCDKLTIYANEGSYAAKYAEEKYITLSVKGGGKNYDDMDGHEFERFCADLLLNNGFSKADVTSGSGDFGVDILAEKDGITYAIQCKCYSSDIGNTAVQEIFSGKEYYKRHIGVVMTNQNFTSAAKKTAERTGIVLWDRDKIEEWL